MLVIPDPKYRKPRAKTTLPAHKPPAPPAALVLVSAELDLGGPWVTLTFDRAIDVAGFVGSAIVVEDETAGTNVSRHRAGD
ncbi:MAG TPA: hypothetical protein VGR35_16690, partial [Tepidisphaeraceae bacterium]|nr:hypothetical protein [Tepidisphaeraceae bacterium]